MGAGRIKALAIETFAEWTDDDALQWGAALSYYTALAMAPLLVLLLGLTTLFVEEQTVRTQLLDRIGTWVGSGGVEIARSVLESDSASGIRASLTSGALVVFGATGVFAQLQKALNGMWEVEPEEGGVRKMLQGRLLGFGLVLLIGLLLLAAVAARAVISGLPAPGVAVEALNLGITLCIFTVALALVYKVLPDVQIHWREVWVGAAATALLFVVGQIAIGIYLGHAAPGSAYGAAGSLVAVLVWIYYSAAVFLLGAEFTQVWARRTGRRIEPQAGARRIREVVAGSRDADGKEPDGGDVGRAGFSRDDRLR